MPLEDITISKAIITRYNQELLAALESDVAIAGGGPSGLVAAFYLAQQGAQVVLFERNLSLGGGMWGGGMMFNQIVVQEEAIPILDTFGVRYRTFEPGYYTAHATETVAAIILGAVRKGVKILNLISAEDVMVRNERVCGLVLNWTAVGLARLHVDPIAASCSCVIDCTGHDAQIANIVVRKMGAVLKTSSGKIEGEKPMWAERGEAAIIKNTGEIYPGLYVAGMAANAVYGNHRMGPVFGGMLLSGKRAAELIRGER
ncbi:MAG TPA: ribose 1,5-bisphosphate isomerase [Desulfotomaculum sp.]|nr:ribose 1,5-bisphosphate isomerase [Desulfotomaculum sp.]